MSKKIYAVYRNLDEAFSENDVSYHSHHEFEIYYFHRGNCKYVIGDQIHYLQEDDIIIMNGMTLHYANPEPGSAYERSVVEFSPEWIKPVLDSLNVPELLTPFKKLSNSLVRGADKRKLNDIKELIGKIAWLALNNDDVSEQNFSERLKEGELSALLVQLLCKIYELSELKLSQLPPESSEKNIHVNRAISWIDRHFHNEISLSTVAGSLNINKHYLSRIFKEVTGYTIMQYLMSCRINRAKYLLEIEIEKSILEVALESGFENASHFSRAFRKWVKVTPSEYRTKRAGTYETEAQRIR